MSKPNKPTNKPTEKPDKPAGKDKPVRNAAGGVLWRLTPASTAPDSTAPASTAPSGQAGNGLAGHPALHVALVHRPRYGDWSLPKGKLEPGETELAAAVREVGEETGLRSLVQRRLGSVHYEVPRRQDDRQGGQQDGQGGQQDGQGGQQDGHRKRVDYWAMRYLDGQFTPNDEVDELRWCTPEQAQELASYDGDRRVLRQFAAAPVTDAVVVLVRHAKAGKRARWQGDDNLRPLEPAGQRQAEALVAALGPFGPSRVLSAEPLRCVQTLRPLAGHLGVPVELAPAFGDHAYLHDPVGTAQALLRLGKTPSAASVENTVDAGNAVGTVSAVCSQGTAIPAVLGDLVAGLQSANTRKGEFWVLSFHQGEIIAADHYPAPVR